MTDIRDEYPDLDFIASYSQISRYLGCEQRYAYRYRDGFKSAPSYAMTLGTVTHHLLDLWWTKQGIPDLDTIVQYTIDLETTVETVEMCNDIAEHALWLIRRYDKMYAENLETCEVVAVEKEIVFELPQIGEYRFGLLAKIDKLIMSQHYGGLVFLDHKTTGSFPKEDTLDIDPQFSIYHLALRSMGTPVVISLMDILYTYRRTKSKKTLEWDEYPVEESFRRVPADRTDYALNVVASDCYEAMSRMITVRNGIQRPLRNVGTECGWCDFRAPCFEALQGDASGEQAVLNEYFHPDIVRRPRVSNSDPHNEEIHIP